MQNKIQSETQAIFLFKTKICEREEGAYKQEKKNRKVLC